MVYQQQAIVDLYSKSHTKSQISLYLLLTSLLDWIIGNIWNEILPIWNG